MRIMVDINIITSAYTYVVEHAEARGKGWRRKIV
jgi:hypothetical protein